MRMAGDVGKGPCFVFFRDVKEEQFFKARNVIFLFESTRAEELLSPHWDGPGKLFCTLFEVFAWCKWFWMTAGPGLTLWYSQVTSLLKKQCKWQSVIPQVWDLLLCQHTHFLWLSAWRCIKVNVALGVLFSRGKKKSFNRRAGQCCGWVRSPWCMSVGRAKTGSRAWVCSTPLGC